MSSFADLVTAQAGIAAEVAVVKTDVDSLLASVAALKAQLASLPPPGLTADQQASLDDAVAKATAMAASLTAIDAEVNPPAPVVVPAPTS